MDNPDIKSLILKENLIEIRGYQNFDIKEKSILIPYLNTFTHKTIFADLPMQISTIDYLLNEIKPKKFCDFGSCLGAIPIYAALKGINSFGVDYNPAYIKFSNFLSSLVDLDINFVESNTQYLNSNEFDLINCFATWHHLFVRTESNQINELLKKFMNSCSYLLLGFPSENDLKAKKWTKASKNYNRALLEELIIKNNYKYKVIHECENRPIFLINH